MRRRVGASVSVLVVLVGGWAWAQKVPTRADVERVDGLFALGNYSRAYQVLDEIAQSREASKTVRLDAQNRLAFFYEEYAGDFTTALTLYARTERALPERALPERTVTERAGSEKSDRDGKGDGGDAGVGSADPDRGALRELKEYAAEGIERIRSRQRRYADEDAALAGVQSAGIRSEKPEGIKRNIEDLRTIVERQPDYYRAAEVYYYIGVHYVELERYRRAAAAFDRALELKPAMMFYVDVGFQVEIARTRYQRRAASRIAWTALIVLLLVGGAVFYASRPWRGVPIRAFVVLGIAILLWVGTFLASYALLARTVDVEGLSARYTGECPAYVSAERGSPGSEVTDRLLVYGIMGVAGVWAFAVGLRKLRKGLLRVSAGAALGLVLFSSLAAIFYLRHCDTEGTFESSGRPGTAEYYATGSVQFFLRDLEPFILTDPLRYPNLVVLHTSDEHFANWIIEYCPFDNVTEDAATGPEIEGGETGTKEEGDRRE